MYKYVFLPAMVLIQPMCFMEVKNIFERAQLKYTYIYIYIYIYIYYIYIYIYIYTYIII